jgi:CheY-like chemotaxis protein
VELIERVLRVVDKQIAEKGLKLECVIDDQMPRKVIGDANRLNQVLLNMLSNAVKFTLQGCIRVEARVIGLGNNDAEFEIVMLDDGIGMSPEALENVFLPFVQADASTTRKFGGTGLGLAISHSLTEMMGGSLTLQSELGHGTKATLRVKFPLAVPEVKDSELNSAESDDQGSQVKKLRFERVLIVEDNPINQRVTELQMKKFTKLIDIAVNGQEAVEMFGKNRYDLVLMDCQMPVMDGFDATLQIRALELQRNLPRTPILALTANVYPADQQRVFDVGMDGFLAKPLRIDVLAAELEKFRSGAH